MLPFLVISSPNDRFNAFGNHWIERIAIDFLPEQAELKQIYNNKAEYSQISSISGYFWAQGENSLNSINDGLSVNFDNGSLHGRNKYNPDKVICIGL